MNKITDNLKLKSWIFYFWLAVAVICAYKFIMELDYVFNLVGQFFSIISPFIAGFVLAYFLNIPCSRLRLLFQKNKNPLIRQKEKSLSILIIYLGLILLFYLLLRIVIPAIYKSAYHFALNFQVYLSNLEDFFNYINNFEVLPFELSVDSIFQTSTLLSVVNTVGVDNIMSSIATIFSMSAYIFKGFLAFISSLYMLFEKERFSAFATRLISVMLQSSHYKITMKYLSQINQYFKQYIFCQTIDGCILGAVATIELFLLRSEYALLLGILLGVVNFIPYFGAIFGSLFAVVVVCFTQGLTTGILSAVVLLVTQQLDGNLLQPRLMGGSFSLSPLLIIISITIGGAVAGPIGMIAAIPITAVLKNILTDWITFRETRKTAV